MSLIDNLKREVSLIPYIVAECEDEGLCVGFESDVDKENTVIIKVDDFYNGLNMSITPASIDCLIIQFCGADKYHIYLVELKNVKAPGSIGNKNLEEKYETTLNDFMSNKFRHFFFNTTYLLNLELILSAGSVGQNSIKSYSLDFLLGLRLYKFQDKILGINGLPPHPLISNCS